MAYTLTYSGGTITVNDRTINTTNTSLALPGRNYASYGSAVDQDLVSLLENFASAVGGPVNPIRGQLWFDTASGTLALNTSSTSTPSWSTVAISSPASNVEFGSVTSGNLTTGANTTAGSITGNWTLTAGSRLNATYADVGERFKSDAQYPVGTVMMVGGQHEVTQISDESDSVLGVISDTAALVMNNIDVSQPVVGLLGRVKVRIVGPITKGQKIGAATNGCAKVTTDSVQTFGWALETNQDTSEKLVLCVIK